MTNPVKTYKIVQTPEVFMTKPTRTYKGQHYWSGILKPHTRQRRDGNNAARMEIALRRVWRAVLILASGEKGEVRSKQAL